MRAERMSDLRIGERLREMLSPAKAALVLTQLDIRIRAASKFDRANELLFTRAGLEQATSDRIARYRAERYSAMNHVIDLCTGIGGDLMALAGTGAELTAVDLDPVHLFLAEHNTRAIHRHAVLTPRLMDVRDVEITPDQAVFIDPARRTSSGKRTGWDSEPSIEWSLSLMSRTAAVGIKTAPGIPFDLIPHGWEIELIALGSDLKEAVLWSPLLASTSRRATVVEPGAVHSLTPVSGDPVTLMQPRPGQWLHDVNPAVTNAGLAEDLARTLGAFRIDEEIGFLISDLPIASPFTTSWPIIEVLPWHEKRIKQALAGLDIGPVDIRRRGLAGDVPAITRRLRGKGKSRALVAMTRINNDPYAIICEH